jgi:hypothetical protein
MQVAAAGGGEGMKYGIKFVSAVSAIVLASETFAAAQICDDLLRSYSGGAEAIFYQTRDGPRMLRGTHGQPDGLIGNKVFFLRRLVRAPGGVLVVKVGKEVISERNTEKRVELNRGRLTGKKVLDCRQDEKTRDFLDRFNDDRTVSYSTHQAYANARESDAERESAEDYEKLQGFHFAFKNRKVSGFDREFPCERTDRKHNRYQSSLVREETGSQAFFARAMRRLRSLSGPSRAEQDARTQQWQVYMIPYDQHPSFSGRACIEVTVPDLRDAKYLRINDLEARAGGEHTPDRGWDAAR